MKRKGVRLGELELQVMDFVWRQSKPVTVPDVHAHLQRTRELAYTTTMTVMTRLFVKGLLDRRENRRPYSYRPRVARGDYSAQLMINVLAEVGDKRAALARFIEKIGRKDAELLKELIRQRGKLK